MRGAGEQGERTKYDVGDLRVRKLGGAVGRSEMRLAKDGARGSVTISMGDEDIPRKLPPTMPPTTHCCMKRTPSLRVHVQFVTVSGPSRLATDRSSYPSTIADAPDFTRERARWLEVAVLRSYLDLLADAVMGVQRIDR